MEETDKDLDIVLFGATGYTGTLTALYLAEHAGYLKWAIAGRNKKQLDVVKERMITINSECERIEILIADTSDKESVARMVKRTRVLLTTVGPFLLYSIPIVDACVRFGTHYCDITGEAPFIKSISDRYHEEAERKGVLIVPSCGFDSIPSDLGVLFMSEQIAKGEGSNTPCGTVTHYVNIKASASGGTLSTMMLLVGDKTTRKQLLDPYLIVPEGHKPSANKEPRLIPIQYSSDVGAWTVPFVMEGINKGNVYRSNALLGDKYGKIGETFTYHERLVCKSFLAAVLFVLGMAVLFLFLSIAFLRNNVVRRFLPKPGTGPSEEELNKGWMKLTFVARPNKKDGKVYKTSVKGGEPGYLGAAKMLAECGICLATQRDELPCGKRGGVMTPASSMGNVLLERLNRAQITFSTL